MSFENFQNTNISDKKRKIVIASVDIEQQARDIAEEKLLSSKAETKGFRGFFQKIWKQNLAHEYYRQKEIAKARREIKESGNLYVGEKGEKADHENAMAAIVKRFEMEYENESLLRKGEEKKILKGSDEASNQLKNGISELIKRFASGNLTEEEFQIEKKNIYGEHVLEVKNASVFADNLLEIAKQVKESISHGKGLDALDDDFEIVIGRARAGVETEAQYNAVDKITDKIQKSFVGKFVNETTVASAVAIAYGAIAKGATNVAHRGAKLVGPLGMGLSAGIGGAVAGVRENKRIKEERAQHAREMAKGKEIESGSRKREEMEKFRYETKNASELTSNLKGSLEELKTNPSEQKLFNVLNYLNEIGSRISFSEREKIDLISFSDSKDIEKERTDIYVAIAEAKVFLKKNIGKDWATFYTSQQELDDYLQHAKEVKIQNDFLKEKNLKDQTFNKMKQKRVAWAVTKGLGIGLGVGMAAQEIGAYVGNGKEGVLEKTNLREGDHHFTALAYLKHYIAGDLPADQVVQKMPQHLMPNAALSIHEISSHEAVVDTKEYIKNHENLFSRIKREAWADNNTSRPDKNELKLWWGGNKGTGIDKNGNYIFNVKHMTHEGSFHDGKHWDPQQLMREGKMKMLISLSGNTQNNVVEVPIDANGNAIIDPNSEIGKIAFENIGGRAKFLGKFAEVAVTDKKIDGIEHVSVLASHVGKGVENFKTVVSEDHVTYPANPISAQPKMPHISVHHADYDVSAPYVIPVVPHQPLERLKEKERTNEKEKVDTETEQNLEKYPVTPGAEFVGPINPYTEEPTKDFMGPIKNEYTQDPTMEFVGPIVAGSIVMESILKPEKKNWWEVKRETEVMAVEDLSGSMQTFEEHVRDLKVAEKDSNGNWKWTGSNKRLVFLGDILGDRAMHGTKISLLIEDFAKQAEQTGGNIDFLCGNHDATFVGFLSHSFKGNFNEEQTSSLSRQNIGIWELAQFDPDQNSELKSIDPFSSEFGKREAELWNKLYDKTPIILENMKVDETGKKILESICKMKVAVVYDDTLYCHTDPTVNIMKDLIGNKDIAKKVSEINKIFQDNLRGTLFEDKKLDDNFWKIEDIYLNAENRDYFTEDINFSKIKEELLNDIILNFQDAGLIRTLSGKEHFERVSEVNPFPFFISFENRLNGLISDITSLTYDLNLMNKSVEAWRKKKDIKGEYLQEIENFFNALNRKSKNDVYVAVSKLEDRIKDLNQDKNYVERSKELGINAIIHGHSPLSDRYYDKNDFVIVSPHASFGDGNGQGTLIIQKNGRIDLKGKSFREQVPQALTTAHSVPANQPLSQPSQQEIEIQKQEKISDSVKKMSDLFSDFELSYEAIKKESEKINISKRELAEQFVKHNPELRSKFETELNSMSSDKRDEKAIEKLAITVILEEEKRKVEERINIEGDNDVLTIMRKEIEVELFKIKLRKN